MNSTRLILTLVIVFIGIIHCSAFVRRQDIDEIDSSELFRDNHGCDAALRSCGKNGKCCDAHDACYKRHKCTASSWFHLCKSNKFNL